MVAQVNTDYMIFVLDDTDQESLQLQIDSLCDTLYMEARIRSLGFNIVDEGEEWNF